MGASLTNAALALYFLSCVGGVLYLLRGRDAAYRVSFSLSSGAFAALTIALALRWVEAGRPPLANLYETLVFLAWASWLTALLLFVPRGMREPAALSPLVSVACLAYASVLDPSIRPLFPALRSNWLAVHVAANLLAYAAFAAAFLAGIGLAARIGRPSAAGWERACVLCVRFGFLFLTYGILTGSVWAQEAWTTYWGWDPKEVWALLTWLFYLSFLSIRARRGKGARPRGRTAPLTALFSIAGFLFALFTYLGVGFLMQSTHGYLQGQIFTLH